jgi:transcriptional regulator with XRE-family HTH domain
MPPSNLARSAHAPPTEAGFGPLLRAWRQRRRLSQLDLALDAGISSRHLSFVETGKSAPSRAMVLRLAEQLGVPLRERNQMLIAAGYAPAFSERSFDAPSLAAARRAVETVLAAHEPFPALAIDRHWTMVAANRAVAPLLAGVDPALAAPPCNVLRLSLHPDGLQRRIRNLAEWRSHILARLHRQVEATADAGLAALMEELRAYPLPRTTPGRSGGSDTSDVCVPLVLDTPLGALSFISTTTVFGTPVDVTLSEIAVEAFFPADAETAEALRRSSGTLVGRPPQL